MKKKIRWYNKPLPRGVCQAMNKGDHCVVAWGHIGFMLFIVAVLTVLTIMSPDPKPLPDCKPVAQELSSDS